MSNIIEYMLKTSRNVIFSKSKKTTSKNTQKKSNVKNQPGFWVLGYLGGIGGVWGGGNYKLIIKWLIKWLIEWLIKWLIKCLHKGLPQRRWDAEGRLLQVEGRLLPPPSGRRPPTSWRLALNSTDQA